MKVSTFGIIKARAVNCVRKAGNTFIQRPLVMLRNMQLDRGIFHQRVDKQTPWLFVPLIAGVARAPVTSWFNSSRNSAACDMGSRAEASPNKPSAWPWPSVDRSADASAEGCCGPLQPMPCMMHLPRSWRDSSLSRRHCHPRILRRSTVMQWACAAALAGSRDAAGSAAEPLALLCVLFAGHTGLSSESPPRSIELDESLFSQGTSVGWPRRVHT